MNNLETADGQLEINLNSLADPKLTGFRLQRLEVFNWGTFNDRVWTLNLNGQNSLLTGDIGSGKSTIVDAVTTLLIPAQRIAYNKAAGAENKERTLRSYVLGYYKSERNEGSSTAKPVALRDQSSYSVILGVFKNEVYDQTVTLAQVFTLKDDQGQPNRFFVAGERALSIAGDFSNFGGDLTRLRKKIKNLNCEVFDTFPFYSAWFKRRFGIANDQALELFHQTVSMKSVGNLTSFVRSHMLEPSDVGKRLQDLIEHFENLNMAHDAVLKAVRQVAMLTPIAGDCREHAKVQETSDDLRASREALKTYFADLRLKLLADRISHLNDEWEKRNAKTKNLEERLDKERAQEASLRQSIIENGGDRIERLAAEIKSKEADKKQRQRKFDRYSELLKALSLEITIDNDSFITQRQQFAVQTEKVTQAQATLQNEHTETSVARKTLKSEHEQLLAEITSLKSRKSNIPGAQIAMRSAMARALNLKETEMPFAGEVLQVHEHEEKWEGAAERLLRNFGLSLLIPDQHYAAVADWVDATNLNGRLIYFRVLKNLRQDLPELRANTLASKIAIKPDSPFYNWLEREIAHRCDLVCCESQEHFRRETRAITLKGQIKAGNDRHEKDDRHRLDDRSRFILGWTNEAKIAALESQARQLASQLATLELRLNQINQEQNVLNQQKEALSKLTEYTDFNDIDWQSVAKDIAKLETEKQQLESASNILKELTAKLDALKPEILETQNQLEENRDRRSKLEQKKTDAQALEKETKLITEDPSQAWCFSRFALLAQLHTEALPEQQLTVENCDRHQQDMRGWLQEKIDREDRKLKTLQARIIQDMTKFKSAFPLEAQEIDCNIEAAHEYLQMLKSLQEDDLPRFQAKFKEMLNENTIREIANFQSQLARERETMKERIARINESLTQIDYNPGRYIVLEAQLTQDAEIRDFQTDLRACTEGSFTGSEDTEYTEEKFLLVKAIIQRFIGREGQTELDQRWTSRVTDVRNWFTFGASERWREDHSEHEHYSDSGGKSGGQKEKLAYTILAASLAYQFGLEWGATRSRSFHFVVIDEAFGRGSDESAQYGLKLFDQLNLQLLVVTPLQKIHIIEPFVKTVGYVQNDGGSASKLRNLTIEEYQEQKAAHKISAEELPPANSKVTVTIEPQPESDEPSPALSISQDTQDSLGNSDNYDSHAPFQSKDSLSPTSVENVATSTQQESNETENVQMRFF
jgi:uncharacterized protein YPO0396